MFASTLYSYRDRNIVDIKTLVQVLKFVIINTILAIIFFCLIIEELDWAVFTFRENVKDRVIDNSSWNIKTIF